LYNEFFPERFRCLGGIFDGDESIDGLARELISDADHGCLGDGMMLNQGSLDLSCGQTVATNVDDVIDTAADPVEAFVVPACAVPGELFPSQSSDTCNPHNGTLT
jgi:hypothetical protein